MVEVLLDTNIYGKIIDDKEQGLELAEKIKTDSMFIIPNFKLIRNELRGAPKILPLYDGLVSRKTVLENRLIGDLAQEYFKEYKTNHGNQGKTKMLNDFKIVACASIYKFGICLAKTKAFC